MNQNERIELIKTLSIEDVDHIINVFQNQIFIFDPESNDSKDIDFTCFNGPYLQINVK